MFTVDPVPEMTVEPYEFNYTCSTDGFYDNVTYQWNKVDLVSLATYFFVLYKALNSAVLTIDRPFSLFFF